MNRLYRFPFLHCALTGAILKLGEECRTFATLTCEPNEMIATIYDRMPVIGLTSRNFYFARAPGCLGVVQRGLALEAPHSPWL